MTGSSEGPSPSARTSSSEDDGAVKVVVRVRPPLPREFSGYQPYKTAVAVDPSSKLITLSENLAALANNGVEGGMLYNSYRFTFDNVYGPETGQEAVYDQCARPAVLNVLQGYNASIIAYGQTGTGKTFTMEGEEDGERAGIIPRAIHDVFSSIARDTGERCRFLVRASYLQIYNEVISDLLKPGSQNLGVREDRRRGVHVEGLSEWVVRTPGEVFMLMQQGAAARTTGATKLNEVSSRSHAIFMLTVEKATLMGEEGADPSAPSGGMAAAMELAGVAGAAAPALRQTVRVGKLNLVDLAGSERVHVTGATGQRLEESKKINQSLSTLGNVISSLAGAGRGREGGRPHVPYRDSKLTRILEDSLGGNCKTTFLAMISPAVEAFSESLSTLKFANRAKNVRNAPTVNEDLDHRTLLRKYEQELRKLRAELQQKSKDLVDKRLLLELDAARRREQADKLAAISALERQSAEIMRHKAAMAALQGRISLMQSQLLVGGHRVEDTPQFRQLLAAEQDRIRGQYQQRLAELEAERVVMAEGQAQVERYRSLLCKQRDIMNALTQRLGERDDQVLSLQADLDAALSRQRHLEDGLDARTAELLGMRRAATEAQPQEVAPERGQGVGHVGSRGPSLESVEAWRIAAVRPETSEPTTRRGPMLLASHNDSASDTGSSVQCSSVSQEELEEERGVVTQPPPAPPSTTSLSSAVTTRKALAATALSPKPSMFSIPPNHFSPSAADAVALQSRVEALQRERGALRCILEEKVAVVVADAERSLNGLGAESSSEATQKLAQQLAYVQSLVGATINAMSLQ